MRSKKQILASRANGARSRGPVTEEGKCRSSQNALRHGLLAKCVVLCNESRPDFEETFQQYIDRFQPVDEVEFTFVEEMAVNYWRLRRAWSIETKMFDQRIVTMKPGDEMACVVRSLDDLASAQTLTLLNRYETRIHCAFQRALRNLLMLRSRQEPNEPKDPALAKAPHHDPEQSPEPEHLDVVQSYEDAAGLLVGVPPAESQPADEASIPEPDDCELPNEPKAPLPAQAAPQPATQPPPSPEPNGHELPNEPEAPATQQSVSENLPPDAEEPPEYEFITVYL